MAVTEDTTVEIRGDGFSTGPIPMDEFEDRTDRAVERLRRRQLTFDIGGATPDTASLKVAGSLGVPRDLRKGDEFTITVTDEEGEVVARGSGYVSSVAFKDKRNQHGDIESTERAHTVTLD